MLKMTEEINDILKLGYALATEPYFQKLLDTLMEGCMKFTSADFGLIYIMSREQLKLYNVVCKNKTLDARHESYEAPDDMIDICAQNMMAFAASHKAIQFVDDIYTEKHFETLSVKEFDTRHHYRTGSIMVVPIYDPDKKIIGVMQLINCMDKGSIVPFPKEYAGLVSSLTSQMAVTLTNINKLQEFDELLDSFVNCMTTAIDTRTPYNANHTRNVAEYCMEVVAYINSLHTRGEYRNFINEGEREQLKLAARLHDLGKMITPREVLNKATRLGGKLDSLVDRLEKIVLNMKIDKLEGRESYDLMEEFRLDNFIKKLPEINIKERLDEDEINKINEMSQKVYYDARNRVKIPYLTEEEKKSLSITRGTLTAEEREIVQQHVVYTEKMLEEIKFSSKYNRVSQIASCHHEFLDGSGYPNHITGDKLDNLTRILTIVDIYESLTSTDRPYKGIMPVGRAIEILKSMANEGKLDKELTGIICDYMGKKNGIESEEKSEADEDSANGNVLPAADDNLEMDTSEIASGISSEINSDEAKVDTTDTKEFNEVKEDLVEVKENLVEIKADKEDPVNTETTNGPSQEPLKESSEESSEDSSQESSQETLKESSKGTIIEAIIESDDIEKKNIENNGSIKQIVSSNGLYVRNVDMTQLLKK